MLVNTSARQKRFVEENLYKYYLENIKSQKKRVQKFERFLSHANFLSKSLIFQSKNQIQNVIFQDTFNININEL